MRKILKLLAALIFSFAPPLQAAEPANRNELNHSLGHQVQFGQPAGVENMLRQGADPAGLISGRPLLSVAASRYDDLAIPIARLLIAANADVNEGGPQKNFPLLVAAERNNIKLVRFLLNEAKADDRVRNFDNQTLRDIAKQRGNQEIIALIDQRIAERAAIYKEQRSDEHRVAQLEELAYSSCGLGYYNFYYQSEQKTYSPQEIEAGLEPWKARIAAAAGDLSTIFLYPTKTLVEVGRQAANRINHDLDNLVTNRNRKRLEVGTAPDAEKRCRTVLEEMKDDLPGPPKKRRAG